MDIYIVGMKNNSCVMSWMYIQTYERPPDWTDNMCEWYAYIKALEYINENKPKKVTIIMDSRLVYKQITREIKIKSKKLRILYYESIPLTNMIKNFCKLEYKLVDKNDNRARKYA